MALSWLFRLNLLAKKHQQIKEMMHGTRARFHIVISHTCADMQWSKLSSPNLKQNQKLKSSNTSDDVYKKDDDIKTLLPSSAVKQWGVWDALMCFWEGNMWSWNSQFHPFISLTKKGECKRYSIIFRVWTWEKDDLNIQNSQEKLLKRILKLINCTAACQRQFGINCECYYSVK